MSDTLAIAKRYYQAYENSDRAEIEHLVAQDFHFTSPQDNRLDRAAYFEGCWLNHEHIDHFDLVHMAESGNDVFITYEGTSKSGRQFRNTEILRIEGNQVTSVEVYFGWNLPHDVAEGCSADT